MKKLKNGDRAICMQYDVIQRDCFYFDKEKMCCGFRQENNVNDRYLNRKVIITGYNESEDSYAVTFLDNGETLAWVISDDLVPCKGFEMSWCDQ